VSLNNLKIIHLQVDCEPQFVTHCCKATWEHFFFLPYVISTRFGRGIPICRDKEVHGCLLQSVAYLAWLLDWKTEPMLRAAWIMRYCCLWEEKQWRMCRYGTCRC
jgi:hypothetical protein